MENTGTAVVNHVNRVRSNGVEKVVKIQTFSILLLNPKTVHCCVWMMPNDWMSLESSNADNMVVNLSPLSGG